MRGQSGAGHSIVQAESDHPGWSGIWGLQFDGFSRVYSSQVRGLLANRRQDPLIDLF